MKEPSNTKKEQQILRFSSHESGKITSGIVHFVDKDRVICSQKGKLYQRFEKDNSWNLLIDSTSEYKEKIIVQSKLLSRLFRWHVYHVIPFANNWMVFGFKKIYLLTYDLKKIISQDYISGSRPLNVCFNETGIYYGEYLSNQQRKSVNIWNYSNNTNKWQQVYQFDNIRHIHGIYEDPYTKTIYITTGDKNHEAAIYKTTNGFDTVKKIISGSQQTRAIKLLFDENFIYFGSDTPDEKNNLYKLNKKTNELTRLTSVGSSVFHGCKVKNWFFFSTAIEPSKVNKTKFAEVWASPDGDNWKCVLKLKKDIFPMRYFQYGQIFFPKGPGDDENLWLSPFATKYSNKTIKIPLEKIKEHFNK